MTFNRQLYESATNRDTWWHCDFCGDHTPAEEPYVVGDSEPCVCGHGVARVMTLKDAARLESAIVRGLIKPREAYSSDGGGHDPLAEEES